MDFFETTFGALIIGLIISVPYIYITFLFAFSPSKAFQLLRPIAGAYIWFLVIALLVSSILLIPFSIGLIELSVDAIIDGSKTIKLANYKNMTFYEWYDLLKVGLNLETSVPVYLGTLLFATIGSSRMKDAKERIDFDRQKERIKDAHGAKGWATKAEIKNRLGAPNGGIHIGELWHWNEKGHMLLVGGSGQGKGVNLIIPTLLSDGLSYNETSVVVLDPKGENAAITAPHFKNIGYDVHVLNPFHIPEIENLGNSCFNPFDLIDPNDPNSTRLYDVLASSIHNRKGNGDGSFFDNRCRQYISLYLAFSHHIGRGSFTMAHMMLNLSGEERAVLLAKMMSDETFERRDTAKAILSRLTGEAARTEENIFGTIEEAMDIFKNKYVLHSLGSSDFDMRTIAHKPTAIFVCVPFEDLEDYAPWVRIFFNFLMRTLTKHYNQSRKVLLLLDEFPQLGYVEQFEKSAAVLRGYNVTIWPVIQGLGQLQKLYKESWEIFMSSAIIKHWLSTQTDNTTAEYLSKRMPNDVEFVGSNSDGSPKERVKKLLEQNEILVFKDIICEISGLSAPARFKKMPYYNPPFSDNASPNPFN